MHAQIRRRIEHFGVVGLFLAATIGAMPIVFAGDAGSKTPEKRIELQVELGARRSEVWKSWTTTEGVKAFFGRDAKVELKAGGAFEVYFALDAPEGSRGSEGCHILSFLPEELLSFEWNAPPSIPSIRNSGTKTMVVLRFEELSPMRTRVKLSQRGFSEGEDWDKYVKYFENAWPKVLGSLAERHGRPEGVARPDKASLVETWTDGAVTVMAQYGPEKRQDFEVMVPAAVEQVWLALTTAEGIKRFYPANAKIEMRPGGAWDLHGGAENKVMAFVPLEMLAVTGSAPPQFPEVRKGGTWGVFTFEPIGKSMTRLRMSSLGWRAGEKEWDEAFEYFLRNNPVFLNMLRDGLTGSKGK